jgi:hypothetical protein
LLPTLSLFWVAPYLNFHAHVRHYSPHTRFRSVCVKVHKYQNRNSGIYMQTYPSILTNYLIRAQSFLRNCYPVNQEIHIILWNPKVHYSVQNSPSTLPTPSQVNPVHALPQLLSDTFKFILLPMPSLQSDLCLSHLPIEVVYACLLLTKRATCFAHLNLLDFIALIIFGKEYKS